MPKRAVDRPVMQADIAGDASIGTPPFAKREILTALGVGQLFLGHGLASSFEKRHFNSIICLLFSQRVSSVKGSVMQVFRTVLQAVRANMFCTCCGGVRGA